MSDADREAFEADCQKNEVYAGRHREFPEQYQLYETQLRWMGWQAARDCYAPKLSEKEAIDLIQKAMFEEKHTRGYSGTAIDALRAAGIRFKEDA